MEKFTLLELNEYVRRVIALNFQDSVWITAEISQVGISKGHRYIDLLQKDSRGNMTLAQAKANLWYKTYLKLKKNNDFDIDALFASGSEILIKVKIEFHERYGMSLVVEDIDPSYSIGKNALQKQITIDKLQKLGAITKNSALSFPPAFKSIAVISSPTAAGYIDFVNQLKDNAYGYKISSQLYPVKVQGQHAVKEIVGALNSISKENKIFDCIVIIRGGGSKLDLAAFDDFDLCFEASNSSKPIIAGIGHEIDTSILDLVSHTSVKTPTAAAEFIINHNLHFEARINEYAQNIMNSTAIRLQKSSLQINNVQYTIERGTKRKIYTQKTILDNIETSLPYLVKNILSEYGNKLEKFENRANWNNPRKILNRGYSITTINGSLLKNIDNIEPNSTVETKYENGTLISKT